MALFETTEVPVYWGVDDRLSVGTAKINPDGWGTITIHKMFKTVFPEHITGISINGMTIERLPTS